MLTDARASALCHTHTHTQIATIELDKLCTSSHPEDVTLTLWGVTVVELLCADGPVLHALLCIGGGGVGNGQGDGPARSDQEDPQEWAGANFGVGLAPGVVGTGVAANSEGTRVPSAAATVAATPARLVVGSPPVIELAKEVKFFNGGVKLAGIWIKCKCNPPQRLTHGVVKRAGPHQGDRFITCRYFKARCK